MSVIEKPVSESENDRGQGAAKCIARPAFPHAIEESGMAEREIRDDRGQGRLEAYDDGVLAGHIAYFTMAGDPAALVAVHTVVEPDQEGKGIAGSLVREFYAMAAREGVPVVPLCPYAAQWAERHPDEAPVPEAGLVSEAERQLRERPGR
ncbi:GNAT family N-acetyltransferase [Streptomyces sp. NPDC007861]|uniref:GNAT family N-acetyltransferase n=1 Tax=Streptomyces sp. NPDC007861 TaxID=3154893 RepID=UPI0033F9ED05